MSKPVFTDFYTPSGRRNRQSYFLYFIVCFSIQMVAWLLAYGADGYDMFDPFGIGNTGKAGGMTFLAGITWIVVGLSAAFVGAQRCRDFGWTGWAILLTLIPIAGFIFQIALFFIPGERGENRYGPDPLEVSHGRTWDYQGQATRRQPSERAPYHYDQNQRDHRPLP